MTAPESHFSAGDKFEFDVAASDAVIIQRQFLGKTKRDIEIEQVPVARKPAWLAFVIKAIRFYQRKYSTRLGNRCVFDPSCSHYAEMAFRKKGLMLGCLYTIRRLFRCHAKNGGVDELI